MKYAIYLTTILIVFPPALAHANAGGSSGGSLPQQKTVKLTPEQKATVRYNSGIKHRDKAAKLEEKASNEKREKQLAKLAKKIAKEYNKAIADFEKANKLYPQFYEVHGSLGYALRKVGRFDESLAAYNESLRINPSYGNAIEYRGEAYLGLNRIDDAKDAYMALFQNDTVLANKLLAAMHDWIISRRANATGLDSGVIDQFSAWVEQRSELASFVQPTDGSAAENWGVSS